MNISGWINTDARNSVNCPKCGELKTLPCKTPKGRRKFTIHKERVVLYRFGITEEEFYKRHKKI
jgi:hypothetical protein